VTRARGNTAAAVRARRATKVTLDPWRAQGWRLEEERQPDGALVPDLTVFLTGRECPWACVFCDLWRHTTDRPTPVGATWHQLRAALSEAGAQPATAQLKLYNASNFFDPNAIPAVDDASVARLARPFARIIVESHPKLAGERCWRFAERLEGRLEVAMGLETVHPEAQPRLGKGATLDDYAHAARALSAHGIDWRAFVLVGAPWVPAAHDALWVARTAQFAAEHGARHIALIPVRGGNGTLEVLEARGAWTPPTLDTLEAALDACLGRWPEVAISADLWDLDALRGGCPSCRPARHARLRQSNRSAMPAPRLHCPASD